MLKFRVHMWLIGILLGIGLALWLTDTEGGERYAHAASPVFSDVQGHWAAETIDWAVERGVVKGYDDGTFRPNDPVKEPEFLVMLFRAYEEVSIPPLNAGDPWYKPYFSLGEQYNWPVWREIDGKQFNRGRVARVLAASQGQSLGTDQAVQYLLDHKLASGKTSATVAGFGAGDKLLRAEAITLIRNMKERGLKLAKASGDPAQQEEQSAAPQRDGFHVGGVMIGDTEQSVIAALGQPARKDASEYGFQWYIYNKDYSNYIQVGVADGKVVGLYTNGRAWSTAEGATLGTSAAELRRVYGKELTYIVKGRTRFDINSGDGTELRYEIGGSYVTFFIDKLENNTLTAVQVIESKTELAMNAFYGEPSDALRASYERQIADLANAVRARYGLPAFASDSLAAASARKHSKDMATRNFFDHVNPDGKDPFDRMEAEGISFATAMENIAAGQTSAIYAHEVWMNSEGHRRNILGDVERIGVGVHMGGRMSVYYAQNFYTPFD